MEKPFQRILLIKMRFHGDMLLTTPVVSTLKRHYPDAKIDVLLYQDTIPILSENAEINALYGLKNKKAKAGEKITNFVDVLKQLRANRYDLIVNLTDQWMVAALVRCLPARVKISQDFPHRQAAFWRKSFTHHAPVVGDHIVERNLSALRPLGIAEDYRELTMSYAGQNWQAMREQLTAAGVGEHYVVIQPTARQAFKCWDNSKFSQVIDALHHQGYEVVLTSGPGAEDLACVEEIASACETRPVTALAGKTRFTELAALIDHAALFIGVDSAPMHIAAAVKTKVIALFGATDHIAWRPWSEDAVVLWAGNYQPMPTRDQLDRNRRYLSVIPAEEVIAAARTLLPPLNAAVQAGGPL